MPSLQIKDWLGLVTAASPYRVPPGANVSQNNLQILVPGQMQQRPGSDTIYTSRDYDEIVGVYRVTSGFASPNTLVVASKTSPTNLTLRLLAPGGGGTDQDWSSVLLLSTTSGFREPPTYAEDRHGRIHCFIGNNVAPVVFNRNGTAIQTMGIDAPSAAPIVTPIGNGYFVERVDVLDGGSGYWRAPSLLVSGGSPATPARVKAIIQGGSVVSVDVIDGGVGYTTPPSITADDTGVKGSGFLGYGNLGVDPGVQGFLPTVSTTATFSNNSTSITNIAAGSTFKQGMTIRGTGIPANATLAQVTNTTTAVLSSAYTGAGTNTVDIVVSGATITGSTQAKSTAYEVTSGSVSIAYSTASGTQAATASWDVTQQVWTALIPITPAASIFPTSAAYATVKFSVLANTTGNVYRITSSATAPTPTGYTAVAGGFFSTASNTWLSPNQSQAGSYYAADYWIDTDDNTELPTGIPQSWWQQPRYFERNNVDFFAAIAPNTRMIFHKRREVRRLYLGRTNGVPNTPTTYYGDTYTYDYSKISYRYFIGARDEIGGNSDTDAKWAWATAPIGVLNGEPYVDIELQPSYKTGTTPYAAYTNQYVTNRKPKVRIYLKYCPDSWLNGNAAVAGDSFAACNLGWQRTGNQTPLSSSTNKGWWSAGQAETGAASRPIVDFRTSSAGNSGVGIAASTVEVLDPGDGWELNTFFAIQFEQVNAAALYIYSVNTSQFSWLTGGQGNPYIPTSGNSSEVGLIPGNFFFNPVGPTYTDEYNWVVNSSTGYSSKSFSNYRARFYFQASSVSDAEPGPPGAVSGEPSITIPGSGYVDGNTGSFTLRYRANINDPPTTAGLFSDGQTYTFKAVRQTPVTTTSQITSVTIASTGAGYYGSPDIVVQGGGGFGLRVSANTSNGGITSLNIQDQGTNYTTSPVLTTGVTTAKLIPVLRPAMRGVYRCAYRFADYSQTVVAAKQLTTTNASNIATVSNTDGLTPGLVVDHPSLPFMSKIVSIGTSTSALQLVLSQNATASSTSAASFRDTGKPTYYSNFSPITDVDTLLYSNAPNPTQMSWSLSGVTAPSRATHVEFFRTSSDQSLVFYRLEMYGLVSAGAVSIQGQDTLTDEQLFDPDRPNYGAVPIVLPNGNPNAYRFGVPRKDMSVCVAYGDRLWYAVSTSGELANSVFFSEYDEFESCPSVNELSIQNNQRTTDAITALIPFSAYLFVMQTSHCYSISYNSEPSVDASIQMAANRGCLTQHCHDLFDNTLYCMDERGIYAMDSSGNVDSLSDPICDYFQKNLLDLSIRRRFFLKVDPRTSILRAFVALAGQNASSPTFALCYSLVTKTWWTESWPNGITSACAFRFLSTDSDDCVYGAVDGDIYRFTGLRDQQYRSISSVSISNAGSGYITPPTVTAASGSPGAGARFVALLKDGKISEILVVEPGFGYGSYSGQTFLPSVNLTISAPPAGGTQAVATATATLPSIGDDVYPQATVPTSFRTGAYELTNDSNADAKNQQIDRSVTVIYRPTATSTSLMLREYFNNSPYPRLNLMARDRGTGFRHLTSGAATTLDMSSIRSPLGSATGVAKAQFAGRNFTDNAGADRHISVELSTAATNANSGDPEPSQVLLYGLMMNGVIAVGDK